jgi:hypothetical protein
MPKRSLFNQLNQVRGTLDFADLRTYRDLAEQSGRHYLSGTLAVVSGSATVTDSSNAFARNEQNNFIVIDEGAAAGVYQITASGTTGTYNASVSPVPTATDATASYRRHYYQNLEDDLNYLRTMLNLVIGETNWYDEPNTDLRNMAYLIPKTPNQVGDNTQYPGIRSGVATFTLADAASPVGYVSEDAPAAEYTDQGSSVSPGASINFTDDNTMSISILGGFYPADQGVLRVMQAGVVAAELDLAAAWTADGCSYEEEESDVNSNPDHTPGGGLDTFTLTNRRCMNTSVDGFPNFWPPYQMASMSATLNLEAGFVGQISVIHTLGGSQNYTHASFFVDQTSQTIGAVAPSFSENTPVTKYLSGVPYYTTNSTFDISITHSTKIFDRGYVTNPLTLNLSQFRASNQIPSLTTLGLTTPLSVDDTIGTYNSSLTVGTGNFRDLDARGTATFRDVFGSATSGDSSAGTFRIDTYGTTATATQENFDDEEWRFSGTEDFTDTGIDNGDSTWNSTDNITTISGLVVYNGTLKYPTLDHSGFLPAGPDYTGQSGDFVYYRVFTTTGAFLQGSITFGGWSNALNVIQGSNVEVYLRLPNCTNYGNGNTNVWQDLSVDQTLSAGNGCLGLGSSGSSVGFSFGSLNDVVGGSSVYGNRIIMKIVYKNSSVTPLTGVTFSPTL